MPRAEAGAALRAGAVAASLAALAAAPPALALAAGIGSGALAPASAAGALGAVDAVGFVVVPQALLGFAIAAHVLEGLAARAAALPPPAAPAWLDPAIESVLLLGMLGTISGMVRAFAGSGSAPLEPGLMVHALGTALRSSYVGFGIALVGVWAKPRAAPARAEVRA
jgi:hypothetical protein